MRSLDKLIGRVGRRLRAQRFLVALVWCLTGCLFVVAVVLAVGAAKPDFQIPGPGWLPFAVACGASVLMAGVIALATGPSRVDASIAIDRAFELNERLSTALTLPEPVRETPAGQALLQDALRHVDGLDVGSKFGLTLPRRAWVPLIPATIALGMLLAPDWVQQQGRAAARTSERLDESVVAKQAESLQKNIARTREKLKESSEPTETARLLAEIEKIAEEMAKSPPAEKDKAMVQINQLSDALKERREQLGNSEQMKKQLQQLKDLSGGGPADEFARDMARGDFEKASETLKELREKLATGKLSDVEQQQLSNQMSQMKDQLKQLSNLDERRKMLEEARKNGGLSQEEFEKQTAKLDAQSEQLKELSKLADQLGAAQQAMQQGDMRKAADALGTSQEQLQAMADSLQELETLDAAMADLMDAKAGMSGDPLNQMGMGMDGMNSFGMGNMNMPGNGQGLGRGRGRGDRPEAPDDVAYYNNKVPQQYGQGKAVIEGFAPPQGTTPGESIVDVQGELEATGAATAEALSNQRVPASVKRHVLGYIDQVRENN